jgi:Swt1-like HEPN
MSDYDSLRSYLFRSLMFEATAEQFRQAGVRVGADEREAEEGLLAEALAPFPLALRNDSLRMARLYAIMYCFENSVRDLIQVRLAEHDPDWWENLVPQKIRRTAISRHDEAQKNQWLEGVNSNLIGFVDFGGLCDIVINCWERFEDLIPSQHWLKQRLDELERVRNFIAHHRLLADAEFARLEMYVRDWNRQVGL